MKLLVLFIFLSCWSLPVFCQTTGRVLNASSGEPLPSASVILFFEGKRTGLVANKEGMFSSPHGCDSIRVSMVGYRSKTFFPNSFSTNNSIEIRLEFVPAELDEVIIKKSTALDIIKKAIAAIPTFQPAKNFENKGFDREIIKDKENYFSVAEAVFAAQYFPLKESYKLKLIQGRSKEDIAYTRLFEDYHPGGGPQSAMNKGLTIEVPDFLNLKKTKYFNYKIDSLVQFDDRWLYSISFDQKPDVKQALDKGVVFIDADELAVVKYEVANSPVGTPYIKDLTGSDKIFAKLLNIDFKRKGWKDHVDFSRIDDKWILTYVESERKIGYKQPKKNIDLDLTINSEMLFTDLMSPVITEITNNDEWKRKNLASSLPSLYDPGFWGNSNIISPTEKVTAIIEKISKSNGERAIDAGEITDSIALSWHYKNRNLFVSFQGLDTVTLIPIMKCWWQDEQSGGMLYKEIAGDFSMEAKIVLRKTKSNEIPDKGFQQAGIIIRKKEDEKENYVFLSIGTGGNPEPKIIFKKTSDGKSKMYTEKISDMELWLRLDKRGNKVTAWSKQQGSNEWKKTGEYMNDWLTTEIQLGLGIYAGFPGDGPKMKPDMKAEFTQIKINMP